ncbi:MAG: lipopolysaccharide kinase InaA family protein [Planctomycetota bacterium]
MQLLRELPGRRVWREGDELVKAFRHPALLLRWRDRLRAENELRVLTRLFERGVAVPRPLGLAREHGWWCARLGWVRDAVSLAEALDGTPLPMARQRVAAGLGKLVAHVQAAGVDQPDQHAGNFLVTTEGRVFGIDFHKARVRRRLSAGGVEANLVELAAYFRERTSRRERARCFVAWWRTFGARRITEPRGEFARRIEDAARERRKLQVAKLAQRWTRASELVRASPDGHLVHRAAHEGERVLERTGTVERVTACWTATARLVEHGLPAAVPLELRRDGRRGTARYAVPTDALPGPLTAAARADLAARLRDRGLGALDDWLTAHETFLSLDGSYRCLPRQNS